MNLSATIIEVSTNIIEIIITFFSTCIIAAIFEEIIFRFGLYKKINKKLNAIISMLITSLIFAVVHFYKIDGYIILTVISFIWNYVFYKTNNLIYSIIFHFAHNLYAFVDNLANLNQYWYCLLIINGLGYIALALKKQKK